MKNDKPKGTECPECGHFNEFHDYVYAHWNILLTCTCDGCKHEYPILNGEIVEE